MADDQKTRQNERSATQDDPVSNEDNATQNRSYPILFVIGLAVGFSLGNALIGGPIGGLIGLIVGGAVGQALQSIASSLLR